MLDFLPQRIKNALSNCNIKCLYELRMRAEKPITVNVEGRYCFLSAFGITKKVSQALIPSFEEIEECIYKAGNYSIYSVEEQIKQGFITANKGIRIGIAGEYVIEKGKVVSVRKINSLCIRIPHEILGCGEKIYQSCMSDRIPNTLICSSPGLGKTTILRDISRLISERRQLNVLICDERGEISEGKIGNSCDVMKYSDKATAFEAGIRAMRPDVIITDELSSRDCDALRKAIYAGVKVIASAHFSEFTFINSSFLDLFDRYVFLKDNVGNITNIYNRDGRSVIS